MTRNPFLNALAASAYIVLIVFVMSTFVDNERFEGTLFIPVIMISLFTLSAAVMGYLFVLQPLRLYLDGEKKAAVDLFLKTVIAFAGITILILFGLFSMAL